MSTQESKWYLSVLIAILFANGSKSQNNLVLNGSFEAHYNADSFYRHKPFGWHCLQDYISKTDINLPHLYRPGSDIFFDAPNTDAGFQEANDGISFAGIGVYDPEFEFRDFLVGELTEPLVAGIKYKIVFYVSLANCSGFAIDNFGISFSNDMKLRQINKNPWFKLVEELKPYYQDNSHMYSDTLNWMKIEGYIVAKGGEDRIVIGSFLSDDDSKIEKRKIPNCKKKDKSVSRSGYYLIDNIDLRKGQ